MIAITFTFMTSHGSLIIAVCHIWWMSTKIKLLIQPLSKYYCSIKPTDGVSYSLNQGESMTKMFSVPWYTIYIARSIPILTILAACMNVYFCVSYIYYLRSILDQILLDYSYHISKIIFKVLLRFMRICNYYSLFWIKTNWSSYFMY